MKRICQCGCGESIPPARHHSHRPPRFVRGHFSRTAANRLAREEMARKRVSSDFVPASGVCECGCGERTPIAKYTRRELGHVKGHPIRFVRGHNTRGKRAHGWKGGRKVTGEGYILVWLPDHHLANISGYVPEHRFVWEQTNGRRLNPDEDVHHIDGNRQNNDPSNLVALTKKQHRALHQESAQTRAKLSDAQRRRYRDPAARTKTAEAIKRAWAEGRLRRD